MPDSRQPGDGSAGFVQIHPNPFIVGNPVRGSAMFFGREYEFDLVRKRLTGAGGLFVFCGERRSGKTSILFQILDHRLGENFIPVLIDMQSMAISNEVDFLSKICDEILEILGPEAHGIRPPDFSTATNAASTFQSFIEKVLRSHPDKRLVLLFDEYELFENKIDAKILGEDVLRILASLMEKKSVFIVFTGSQNIDQRRRPYWGILSKASTFKEISYLEREDALNLIQRPVDGVVHYTPEAVDAIYRLTSGQPFYTQAVCRDLVDWLNEQHTHEVKPETVSAVVDRLIQNPLPQMRFHWQSLTRDEKLVLALLAETLHDGTAYATSKELMRTLARGKYPLIIDEPNIELALDKLYANHLLIKNDRMPSGWAFQMDLWRLWIRREHSVWQVMREEGIDIKEFKRRQLVRRVQRVGAFTALPVVAFVLWLVFRPHPPDPPIPQPANVLRGIVTLNANPPANAFRDGRAIGVARGLVDSLYARSAIYRFSADGYADTSIAVEVDSGRTRRIDVTLRPKVGSLEIATSPPGAEIHIDNVPYGRSPKTISGLRIGVEHPIRLRLAGFAPRDTSVSVQEGQTLRVAVGLAVQAGEVFVNVTPSEARVMVDKAIPVTGGSIRLPVGRHVFVARLDGYQDGAQTVEVTANQTASVNIPLKLLPNGELRVMSLKLATIHIDGEEVGPASYNSKTSLSPGPHHVRIDVKGSPTVLESILIRPDTVTTYDFDKRSTTHTKIETPGS